MAQLTRILQKIFGGGSSQNGQFGSAQLGTPTLSNDPSVIQGLPAWEQGWPAATISGDKLPAMEEVQGVDYVVTRQLAYLFQAGVPEWIATETYYIGSIARDSTGVIYKSLQDNNTNHALTDPVWWDSAVTGGVPDGTYGDIVVSSSGTVWTIANNAVTESKINTDAVTTSKILNASVTPEKLSIAYAPLTPRVQSVASASTVTPTNLDDIIVITAQATGLTLANHSGSMVQGQAFIFRIKDNGTARSIAYGSNYRAIGRPLPTTTVINKTLYLFGVWNSTDTKADITGWSLGA